MNNSAIQDKKSAPQPLLYRWDDLVLSYSNAANQLKPHFHGAAELIVGYQSDVLCKLLEGVSVSAPSILIPPGVSHENEYQDQLSVTMYFDSDSSYFHHLANKMALVEGVFKSLADVSECQGILRWIYENEPELDVCRAKLNAMLVREGELSPAEIDVRIQTVLDELRRNPAHDQPVAYFAAKVRLSEDRLHHLFTDVMGLPMHRYRVWLRLKHASQLYFSGHDLTYAAHDAGFSDAAHFSRTFTKMYGAAPKVTLSSRKDGRYYFS